MKYPVLGLPLSILKEAPLKSPTEEECFINAATATQWADSLDQETWSELRQSPAFIHSFNVLWGHSISLPQEDIYWAHGAGSGCKNSIGIIGIALIEGGVNRKKISVIEAKTHLHFLIQRKVPMFLSGLKTIVKQIRGFNADGTMRVDIEETKRKIRL